MDAAQGQHLMPINQNDQKPVVSYAIINTTCSEKCCRLGPTSSNHGHPVHQPQCSLKDIK